jgi:hypothetical protein
LKVTIKLPARAGLPSGAVSIWKPSDCVVTGCVVTVDAAGAGPDEADEDVDPTGRDWAGGAAFPSGRMLPDDGTPGAPTLWDEAGPGVGCAPDGACCAQVVDPTGRASWTCGLAGVSNACDVGENTPNSGRASASAKPARTAVCFNFICRSSSERDLSPHLKKRPFSHERDKQI